MTLIELGYRDAEPVPPAPSPLRDERLRKRLTVALVAVLCLAGVQASAPVAASRVLHRLWSTPNPLLGSTTEVAGDTLVMLGGTARGRLTGFGLRDGVVRWTRQLPEQTAWLTAVPAAGVILIPVDSEFGGPEPFTGDDSPGAPYYRQTLALDPATGQEKWRAKGDLAYTTANDVLLADYDSTGLKTTALRVAGAADGVVRWQRTIADLGQWSWLGADPTHPDSLVTVTAQDGRATVYRWADGAMVTQGRIAEWPGPDPAHDTAVTVSADGTGGAGGALVTVTSDLGTTVTAYATGSWKRRWRHEGGFGNGSGDCGPVICVGDDGKLLGLDPVSGKPRWQTPSMDFASMSSAGLLMAHTSGDRMVLLDPRDGRQVAALDQGLAISDVDDDIVLLIDPVIGTPTRIAVTQVDPKTGQKFLLGAISAGGGPTSGSDYVCSYDDRLLICTTDGTMTVTAVG